MVTWSNIKHAVGDMHDEEEFLPVSIRLPDGREALVSHWGRDTSGRPCLITDWPEQVAKE